MRKIVDKFIKSINEKNPNLLPLASRYYATENGIPAATRHMEIYRVIDSVSCIGTIAEDELKHSVYVVLSALEGSTSVIIGARLQLDGAFVSELEVNIYRSRSDTGFWFAVEEIEKLEEKWDCIVAEEKRASRETLEEFAEAIFDNTKDGNLYPAAETCILMEAGGAVLENVGYAEKLSPVPLSELPEGTIRIPMGFGLGPIRPNGRNTRILAIDEKRGLVVVNGLMDGYVSPYIVSDEYSSCFVPVPMIDMHRSTLSEDMFEGISTCKEMMATAENTTIAKFYDGKIQYITQNIKIKTYGDDGTWREDVFVK